MSLIHWWPLNGDTRDYGTNNLNGSLIGSTSFDSAGKIGQCLLADTGGLYSGRGVDIPSNLVSELSGKDYSFCAWVKPNGNHVHYEGAIISSGNWNNSCWAFGLNSNNTAINPAGNWYNTSYVSYAFTVGQWYHIVSVQKNGTNYVYVNGSLVGTVSHSPISQSDASNTCIGRETYAGGYFGFNGCINDVRIYDHALSVKEVKEISKCLVLHYNFEDPYVEGTTNLASSITPSRYSGWGTISATKLSDNNYRIKSLHSGATQSYWDSWGYDISSYIGQKITFSFTVKNMATSNATISWVDIGQANSGQYPNHIESSGAGNFVHYDNETANNKRITWTGIVQSPGRVLMEIRTVNSAANGYSQLDLCDIQIEVKDHATPYVNGTRGAGLLYDCSGYGRNGIPVNNPQIVDSNGGSGTKCAKLIDANTYGYFDLGTKTFNFITNGAVCFWAKYPTNSNKMIFGANDNGARYLGAYNGTDDVWYSNLNGGSQGSIYCDGVLRNKPIFDENWHFYCFNGVNLSNWGDLKYFLCIYANNPSNSYQFHGYLADFKIYSTTLSASDVLAEYQRKAAIDKNGNIFTGEIVEQAGKATLPTKNGQVIADDFEEGANKTRIFGGYTELSYLGFSGTQFIRTGIASLTPPFSVITVYNKTNTTVSDQCLVGQRQIGKYPNIYNNFYETVYGNTNSGTALNNAITTIEINSSKGVIKDGDIILSSSTANTQTTSYELLIGAFSEAAYDAAKWFFSGNIYSIEVINEGKLYRHYIPAKRNSDNVIGLFDTVEQKFYTNSGSGSFTAGPEVGELSIICANEVNEL